MLMLNEINNVFVSTHLECLKPTSTKGNSRSLLPQLHIGCWIMMALFDRPRCSRVVGIPPHNSVPCWICLRHDFIGWRWPWLLLDTFIFTPSSTCSLVLNQSVTPTTDGRSIPKIWAEDTKILRRLPRIPFLDVRRTDFCLREYSNRCEYYGWRNYFLVNTQGGSTHTGQG